MVVREGRTKTVKSNEESCLCDEVIKSDFMERGVSDASTRQFRERERLQVR